MVFDANHWWGHWLGMCVAVLMMVGCQSLPHPSTQAGTHFLVIFVVIEDTGPADEQWTRVRIRSGVTWVRVTGSSDGFET